ncbi:MAG: hypothetical protein ACI8XZ_004923 [Gammaproteobacteria bacterium]|jgi:uncharacterized protein YbaR (Trm112 family)
MLSTKTLQQFICPQCFKPDVEFSGGVTELNAAQDGTIACSSCNTSYEVLSGIPFFAADLGEQEKIAKTFGFEWKGWSKGLFDEDDVGGLNIHDTLDYFVNSLGLTEADLEGKRCLMRERAEAGARSFCRIRGATRSRSTSIATYIRLDSEFPTTPRLISSKRIS